MRPHLQVSGLTHPLGRWSCPRVVSASFAATPRPHGAEMAENEAKNRCRRKGQGGTEGGSRPWSGDHVGCRNRAE